MEEETLRKGRIGLEGGWGGKVGGGGNSKKSCNLGFLATFAYARVQHELARPLRSVKDERLGGGCVAGKWRVCGGSVC